MKNIVVTIIIFAIAIGLIVGVIVPIAQHGRTTATSAKTRMTGIDTSITGLSTPINQVVMQVEGYTGKNHPSGYLCSPDYRSCDPSGRTGKRYGPEGI